MSVGAMNILVGPNNCGKSTVLGACRALAAAIRTAKTRAPDIVPNVRGQNRGWRVSAELLPISVENIHHNYSDNDTSARFEFSNGNALSLIFHGDGGCTLFAIAPKPVLTAAAFKRAFPFDIHHVPILGPVESEEQILKPETVARALGTHRASRHFRNYWHQHPDSFSEFASLVQSTWHGMSIEPPKIVGMGSNAKLSMFCVEERILREIYWAGFGFQVWCQLLTHLSAARGKDLLVLDEPETYLHPELQRRLVRLLRDIQPDILLATHSTEIMSDVDPGDLVVVQKRMQSGLRLKGAEQVQKALDAIGSVQNIALAEISRHRRILFVEGPTDGRLLRQFAGKLGHSEIAAGYGLSIVNAEGFSNWEKVVSAAWAFKKAFDADIAIAAVFDRDFRCDEEVSEVLKRAEKELKMAHVHSRKELENYLLVPSALQRALDRELAERFKRSGVVTPSVSVCEILDDITRPLKQSLAGQYIAKRNGFLRPRPDGAREMAETLTWFDSQWQNLDSRLQVVPGKEILASLREKVQSTLGVSLTDSRIIAGMKRDEVASDLADLLARISHFGAKQHAV